MVTYNYKSFMAGLQVGKCLGRPTTQSEQQVIISNGTTQIANEDYDRDSFLRGLAIGRVLWRPAQIESGCIVFRSFIPFTLRTANGVKNWDGKLERKSGSGAWIEWDGTTIHAGLCLNNDGVGEYFIFLRGIDNDLICGAQSRRFVLENDHSDPMWQIIGVHCYGNLETLLDYEAFGNGEHPEMRTNAFSYLFRDSDVLKSAPQIPSGNLSSSCCYEMCRGCTALEIVPDFPNAILASYCFGQMFLGCTALKHAPAIPSTVMAYSCCLNMFYDCTALETASALSAETLARQCFAQMYYRCTSLKNMARLPATTLFEDCYRYMYYRCSNIKVSSTRTGDYQYEFEIPAENEVQPVDVADHMFNLTGGTFTGTPALNTPYYTTEPLV